MSEQKLAEVMSDLLPTSKSVYVCEPLRVFSTDALVEVKSIGAQQRDDLLHDSYILQQTDFEFEVKHCREFTFVILKAWSCDADITETIQHVMA